MIRIVGGRWRGRKLAAPPGTATRPTSDRARKTLFDVLWHARFAGRAAIEGATVLDAFAGTGALALEALSRGAAEATCFETDAAAFAALRANIAACGATAHALRADATAPPQATTPCTLVFLDPPYGGGLPDAALLAAVLPNPKRLKVRAPSVYVRSRQAWILGQMRGLGGVELLRQIEPPPKQTKKKA